MTKDLGKQLHRKHREVLFGIKPIQIVSHKVPESQKIYLRRHNEQLERNHEMLEKANFIQKKKVQFMDEMVKDG